MFLAGEPIPGVASQGRTRVRRRALEACAISDCSRKITNTSLTPNTSSEGDEDAECLRIVFHAFVGVKPLEDPNHDSENDDLAGGTDGERHVRDTVPRNGFKIGMFFHPV